MHRLLLAAMFLAAMLTTGSVPLRACSCGSPAPNSPGSCLAEWAADAVFVGEVVALQELTELDIMRSRRATLNVREAFKGIERGFVAVLTGSGGGDCGFDFSPGSSYLVFERRDPVTGRLSTGICSTIGKSKNESKPWSRLVMAKWGA